MLIHSFYCIYLFILTRNFSCFLLLSEYFDSNGPVTISISSSDHRGNYYILSHDQQLLTKCLQGSILIRFPQNLAQVRRMSYCSHSNKPWISPLWTTSTFLVVPKIPFRLWHWERVGNEHQTVHLTPGNRSARGADWFQPPISDRPTSREEQRGNERARNETRTK